MTDTMTVPKAEWEYKRFLPKGFDKEADTPLEALLQAHALLLDEERWVQGEWYQNHHPEVDPDDPFCNDWKVCAAGAVAMVAIGAARQLTRIVADWDDKNQRYVRKSCPLDNKHWTLNLDRPLDGDQPEGVDVFNEAVEFLRQGSNASQNAYSWDNVPQFNDSTWTTRADVLKAFGRAIAIAAKDEAVAGVKERF